MKFTWHDVAEDVEKHAHRLAEDIFALEPDVAEEVDLKALFERILGKEDWTDKVAAQLGRFKGLFHRPQKETELPEDLKKEYGVDLTPEIKEKIVGGNIARLYGIDVQNKLKAIAGDELSKRRAALPPEPDRGVAGTVET